MKLYMIRKEFLDGSKVYRSAGVYDKWTHSGKCWSNGAFKSFLNYSKLTLDVLKRDAITYKIMVIDNLKKKGCVVEYETKNSIMGVDCKFILIDLV